MPDPPSPGLSAGKRVSSIAASRTVTGSARRQSRAICERSRQPQMMPAQVGCARRSKSAIPAANRRQATQPVVDANPAFAICHNNVCSSTRSCEQLQTYWIRKTTAIFRIDLRAFLTIEIKQSMCLTSTAVTSYFSGKEILGVENYALMLSKIAQSAAWQV